MSGGAQQLVFSMLVQVFIGGRMYLDMTRNGIPTSPDAADTQHKALHIQSMSFYGITYNVYKFQNSWWSGQTKRKISVILPWCILRSLVQIGPDTDPTRPRDGPVKTPSERDTYQCERYLNTHRCVYVRTEQFTALSVNALPVVSSWAVCAAPIRSTV